MKTFLRYHPGELRKRALGNSLLSTAVFDDDDETLQEIVVVTLKQWLRDQAIDEASECCYYAGDVNTIDQITEALLNKKYTHAKEFVYVEKDRITIGINDNVVTDVTVNTALTLLVQIDDLSIFPNKYEFGKEIKIYGS